MTMQASDKVARGAKTKTKPNCKTKMQTSKDADTSGEIAVKVEGQIKTDPDQPDEKPLDSRQFNGHLDSVPSDIAPKVEDGSHLSLKQSKDGVLGPSPNLRPPTRDMPPTNHRMMVGRSSSHSEGPPPNCLAPAGLRFPSMSMGGVAGGVPMGGGQMQVAAGGHFVQNQSPIFVFSTTMANLAAEAYDRGQFESIIHFHRCHPDTQQFLQKYPLNSHPNMNMRPDGSIRQPNMTDGMPESNALANVAQWVQQQNANLQQLSSHSPGMSFSHAPDGPGLRPNGRYGRVQQWGPSPGPHLMPPEMTGPQGYQMFGPQPMFPGDMNMAQGDMMHDPMSKDNLTPQQLQKREQNLASLRKIKEMLLPELQSNVESTGNVGSASMMGGHGNPDGPMPVDGWPPPLMHPGMGLQRPGLAMSPPDGMVNMNFMPRMGSGRPYMGQGGVPSNWDTMTDQQREWWKMEQDFYVDKYQRQHMQMGMNMPSGGGGPNRSHMGFVHPMQQMHRMPGPMSPSFPGNSVPSPHCGPMGMPGDPQSMMFGKPSDFGPMGPEQNFDHPGGLPHEGMFPFGDNQMPPGRFGSAGEPFSPVDFNHPIGQSGLVKMPPMYGPQKRKRSANAVSDDDLYKRLLPAPSPQTFSYVNSIEGQELTITKQLNHAFQEQPGTHPPPTSASPPTYVPPAKSRPTGGKKKKGQTKAAEQKAKPQRTPPAADSFMCPSPAVPMSAVSAVSASCQSVAASPLAQMPPMLAVSSVNRASSADPSQIPAPTSSMTGPMKTSMNITSPSLANLAKGIDNLSAQIQQNPFRTVQMQENESDTSDISPTDNNGLLLPSLGGHGQNLPQSGVPANSSHGAPAASNNALMQPMTPTNPLVSPPGSVRSASHSVVQRQSSSNNNNNGLADAAGLAGCPRQSPGMFSGEESMMEGASRFGFSGGSSLSTVPSASQSSFAAMGSSPGTMSGCRPPNSGGMVTGNAKIQIQAQAPNTIQYLPSHPSSGGQIVDGLGDGFVDFNAEKCTKGGLAPFSSMMGGGLHDTVMPMDVAQRRQMEMQMVQDHGGGAMHSQMRMDPGFDAMHGPRGPMHGPRGALSRTGVPVHMGGGMIQDPASPMLGPGGMMHGMGNPMHHPRSPSMGPSGPMHDQTSPMMGGGPMMGPGGHVLGDMMSMPGHMKPGMMSNGADFGPMMMGPGGRGGDMPPDMVPMTMQRRPMHPDAVMVGGPEFGMAHHEPMMRTMQGCGMMGPEMGMMPMGGREPMISMRGAGGMRSELMSEKSRSNRSRQKARAAETEARMRNEAGAGMMLSDQGASRLAGSNQGMMGMEMMGGMMRQEMAMMGGRPEMMSMSSVGPGVDRIGMRSDSGMMMTRGNGMASDLAMMSSRGVAGSRVGMLEGPGMSPDSVAMFNYGPSRRVMPPDAMDMCQPGMMPPGMSAAGMCPPGMKPMVMQSPAMGQSPGPGMAGDPGFGVQYQQFQQQMYAQSQSPTMSSVMMRGGGGMPGGPPDMMGRPSFEVMGTGPSLTSGAGMGFGQQQPGLGPPGPM